MAVDPNVMAAILHGGMGGGPPQGPPGMPPGGPPGAGGPPSGPPGGDADSHLKTAMAELRQYEQLEQDPEDKSIAAKVYALLSQLLAKDQKEKDQAMGATPATKYLRNASAGGRTA